VEAMGPRRGTEIFRRLDLRAPLPQAWLSPLFQLPDGDYLRSIRPTDNKNSRRLLGVQFKTRPDTLVYRRVVISHSGALRAQ